MHSLTNHRPILFFLFTAWCCYLFTLSPTILYRDAPEFVNTAYALGVSHPAGFPTYNLLAKALTFFPFGSIVFRVNLFSAISALAGLGLLYATSFVLLKLLFREQKSSVFVWSALVPTAYLAFCQSFWSNSVQAEVYTLHVAFTAGLFLLLFLWKDKEDVRFLYGAALVYGLGSGNHATVGFYLPAVLVLFFCWCQKTTIVRDLTRCVAFFLVGFAVYAYLPLRSINEPSFDFGNPETVSGFLYQVFDKKDAHSHFSVVMNPLSKEDGTLSENSLEVITGIFQSTKLFTRSVFLDLTENFSWIPFLGFLAGAFACFRKSKPIFIFFGIVFVVNASFFMNWGKESYFPTYIVVCLLTSVALAHFLNSPWTVSNDENQEASAPRWRPIVWAVLVLWIPYTIAINFNRVDLSKHYNAETMIKRFYLALDNKSLFISGLTWFHYFYHQDVARLRDDVIMLPVWDLLNPNPPGMVTSRRYPDLNLPEPEKYHFESRQNIEKYDHEFFESNKNDRPILMEFNSTIFEQTRLTPAFQPHGSIFVKYDPNGKAGDGLEEWNEFVHVVESELKLPGAGNKEWITMPKFIIESIILYAHDTERFELEAKGLSVMFNFFGYDDAPKKWQWMENRLHSGHVDQARGILGLIVKKFPEAYETALARGRMALFDEKLEEAVEGFQLAAQRRPSAIRPHLELARLFSRLNQPEKSEQALEQAKLRITNLRQLSQWQRAKADMKVKPPSAEGTEG